MGFDGRLLSGMSVLAAVVETGSFTRAGDVLARISHAPSDSEGNGGAGLAGLLGAF